MEKYEQNKYETEYFDQTIGHGKWKIKIITEFVVNESDHPSMDFPNDIEDYIHENYSANFYYKLIVIKLKNEND